MITHPYQESERMLRDRQAAAYDTFFPAWRKQTELEAVLRILHRAFPRGGIGVVDLGTGTGRVPRALAGWAGSVTGVDFSAASIDVAARSLTREKRTAYEWVIAEATDTRLQAGCADVVTSLQLLQHLPTPGHRQALIDEAHRLVRPGGLFVLTCYGRNLLHRLRGERERFTGGLYFYRHSPRDVRKLVATRFGSVSARASVGLPDFLPFPDLDRAMARVPGWGLIGRVVVCSAQNAMNDGVLERTHLT